MKWLYEILDAIPVLWRIIEIKTEAMFLRQLRSYCLHLFRGDLGEFEWIDDMTTTIADQIGKAWREGARAVGVDPSEFTDEDAEELGKIIAGEYDYVLKLGSDILALRLLGGTLEEYRVKFHPRIDIWAHRYTDVVNQAVIWFGKRKKVKLKWTLGETEEHCATCTALNGIIAYADDWERSMVHPQNPPNQALECGGWRCDCSLVPTTERATNNAFDEIVDRVTAAKSLKYDPNQPRVPAGNSDGGQWTDGGNRLGITSEEKQSLENYTNVDYRELNPYLVGVEPSRPHEFRREVARTETLKNLDSLMKKSVIDKDITVFRGFKKKHFDSMVVGETVTDKAFMSTSTEIDKALPFGGVEDRENSYILELKVPAGTHGVFVEEILGYKNESEVLLDRGQKYKVEKITRNAGTAYSDASSRTYIYHVVVASIVKP